MKLMHTPLSTSDIELFMNYCNIKSARAGGNQGSLSDYAVELWAPNDNVTPVVSMDSAIFYLYLP